MPSACSRIVVATRLKGSLHRSSEVTRWCSRKLTHTLIPDLGPDCLASTWSASRYTSATVSSCDGGGREMSFGEHDGHGSQQLPMIAIQPK
jgi:hypothetical protein